MSRMNLLEKEAVCPKCAKELYCGDCGDVVMCVGDFKLYTGGEKPTVDPKFAKIKIPRR